MRTTLQFLLSTVLLACAALPATAQTRLADDPPVVRVSAATPNPFSSATRFTVTVEKTQEVRVELYNLLGQRVVSVYEGPLQAGESRTFAIPADGLPAGLYVYRVQSGKTVISRQVTLIR